MRLKRAARLAVPGSNTGANGIIGRVLPTGARPKQVNSFPGQFTPNPRPPGEPTKLQ